MADFTKYAAEERFRYYDFERDDGRDGLAAGETIVTPSVTIEDSAGTDCSAAMISNVAVSGTTSRKVVYKLKAGTKGEIYDLTASGVTSAGQTVVGKSTIEVI